MIACPGVVVVPVDKTGGANNVTMVTEACASSGRTDDRRHGISMRVDDVIRM